MSNQKILTQPTIIDKSLLFLEKYPIIPTLITFFLIYLIFAIRLDLSLIFKDTILTGGDSASWLQPVEHLRDHLIPNFKLFGWTQSNFFGYNEFQFYFIPPFLFAVILSIFLPLTISLKIATLIGIFTLPIAFYFSVQKITKNLWASLIGAALSLIFLFNESYTMYGGNFLSTLAGEFSYSFSLSIFVFFVGVCYETFEKNKNPIWAGILLGLIGLSHIFVFMPAFFVPFFFIFVNKLLESKKQQVVKKTKKNKQVIVEEEVAFSKEKHLEKILFIYISAILFMAFWLVPMAFTRVYSTSISMIWHFETIKDFFVQTFFVLINVGFIFAIFVFLNSKKNKIISVFILYFYLVCVFFYIIATFLEIPDIRFVPPALIISIFSLAIFFNYAPSFFYDKKEFAITKPIILIVVLIGVSIFVLNYPVNVRSWFNWNYTGYEAKKEFINLQGIRQNYTGNIDSGRILWEKQNQHDNADFGSERGFENLYYFTGRPSMEGIHYGSSFMARAVTYMQSEYSLNPVDPEAYRVYSVVNPDVWSLRFYQTNAKDIILYSDNIKNNFASHPDFEKTGDFGKFSLYTYKYFPKSYIEVRDLSSIAMIDDNKYGFKTDFYRYFRDYELYQTPFIPKKFAKDLYGRLKYYNNYDQFYNDKIGYFKFSEWLANYPYKDSISNEKVDHFNINFTTKEVGKPHIIKVTYSPNFKSKNGEKIYPVSPGFMMIIPTTSEVKIIIGSNKYEIIGLILTLLIIPLIIFRKKIASFTLPFAPLIRTIALAIFIALVCLFLFVSLFSSRKILIDYKIAEKYFNQNDYTLALNIINKYTTPDYLDKYDNGLIYDYYNLKAKILANTGKKQEAKQIYDNLFKRFNHSRQNDNIKGFYNSLK